MERARRHDDAVEEGKDSGDRFSQDEFTILNFGFRNRQEIENFNHRWDANLGTNCAGVTVG
jgi:hypothetical protein